MDSLTVGAAVGECKSSESPGSTIRSMSVMAILGQLRRLRLPSVGGSDRFQFADDASLIGLATTRVPPGHQSKR
jgi:hypothetical protein